MLRAASVGLGWWSDELASAAGRTGRIQISACLSRSEAKREAFAERFGARPCTTCEEFLSDPEIGAVILTTPHSLHAEHVISSAKAGKHVFVEKPFTLTAESGMRAASACSDAGVVLAVGHNRRFSAAGRRLREMLDAGAFGTLLALEGNFSAPGALAYTPDRWRANRVESPAGAIAGLGIHLIDLMCWLAGPVRKVNARAVRRAVSVDMDDTTVVSLAFDSGALGTLGSHFACPYRCSLSLYGTRANAFADIDGNSLLVQTPGNAPESRTIEPVDTLRAELDEFASACAGEGAFRVRPPEAIHNVAVMEAIATSASHDGAPVAPSQ